MSALIAAVSLHAQYDQRMEESVALDPGAKREWYFACRKGDVLSVKGNSDQNWLNFGVSNVNGAVVSTFAPKEKWKEQVKIPEDGVYLFSLLNGDSVAVYRLEIRHRGISGGGKTREVRWIEKETSERVTVSEPYLDTIKYSTVQVHRPQQFYLNSAANLTGRTRVELPVELPENTERWYYTYSCYREEQEAQRVSKGFDLAGQIAGWLIGAEGKLIGLTASVLATPPGGDQCDIYLLDEKQMRAFRDKEDFTYKSEGSRENYASGVVEIDNYRKSCWLGFRNSSLLHGIYVVVEVVAITRQDVWKTRDVELVQKKLERVPMAFFGE